jgi:hypothetical protein
MFNDLFRTTQKPNILVPVSLQRHDFLEEQLLETGNYSISGLCIGQLYSKYLVYKEL